MEKGKKEVTEVTGLEIGWIIFLCIICAIIEIIGATGDNKS